MINVETVAEVTFNYTLSGEDEERIREYVAEHNCSLLEAVEKLSLNTFALYENFQEVDFSTERIKSVDCSN